MPAAGWRGQMDRHYVLQLSNAHMRVRGGGWTKGKLAANNCINWARPMGRPKIERVRGKVWEIWGDMDWRRLGNQLH